MALLTVAELRKHIAHPAGDDADDALQRLLDDAELLIVKHAGASGAVTQLLDGGYGSLILNRPIGSVTSISEDFDGTPLILSANDYRYTVGGYVLRRLSGGTNSAYAWAGTVRVIYTPVDDTVAREAVQIALVHQDINHMPGLTQRTIGDWSESYADNSVTNYDIERERILDRLTGSRSVVLA